MLTQLAHPIKYYFIEFLAKLAVVVQPVNVTLVS